MVETLPAALMAHATARPDVAAFHVIIGDDVTTLTWGQLLRDSTGYAQRYLDAGVAPGEVVLICLPHGPSTYPAYLGAMLAGAVPSFVAFPTPKQDPALYWDAHRVLFDRVLAPAVLTYPEIAVDIGRVVPPSTTVLIDEPVGLAPPVHHHPDRDATALLQHSSGTTGHRKGVMLTYRQIHDHGVSYAARLGLNEATRVVSWLPLYHDMGLFTAFLLPVQIGATVVSIDPFEWVADPHLLFEHADRYRATIAWMPNFAFAHLVRTKRGTETYRLDHVEAFVSASEPCKPRTMSRFLEAFGPHGVRESQLQTLYGMAESVLATTQSPPGTPLRRVWFDRAALRVDRAVVTEPFAPGSEEYLSNGRALDGIEVRIDPTVPTGAGSPVAEIEIRGRFVFSGYYRSPEATAEAFTPDGWYRTGDLGALIDGELYVMGRKKDVIIHHGANYYAHDLEAIASAVPGVKPGRCAAVAVYDEGVGSEQIELIAERDPAHPVPDEDLVHAVKAALSDRLNVAIAQVHLVELGWLVKTTSGKVSRSENLAKLRAETVRRPALEPAPTRSLEDLVIGTIATTFSVDLATIGRHTVAADVKGWDSLGHTVLLIRISQALGVTFPESVAAEASNVGELIDLLREHL